MALSASKGPCPSSRTVQPELTFDGPCAAETGQNEVPRRPGEVPPHIPEICSQRHRSCRVEAIHTHMHAEMVIPVAVNDANARSVSSITVNRNTEEIYRRREYEDKKRSRCMTRAQSKLIARGEWRATCLQQRRSWRLPMSLTSATSHEHR